MATPQPWRAAADRGTTAAPSPCRPRSSACRKRTAHHPRYGRIRRSWCPCAGPSRRRPTAATPPRPSTPPPSPTRRRRRDARCPPTTNPAATRREQQRTSTTDTIESELIATAAGCTPPPDAASHRRPAADAKRAATRSPPRRPRGARTGAPTSVCPLPLTTQRASSRAVRRSAVGWPTAPPAGGAGDDGRAPPRRGVVAAARASCHRAAAVSGLHTHTRGLGTEPQSQSQTTQPSSPYCRWVAVQSQKR